MTGFRTTTCLTLAAAAVAFALACRLRIISGSASGGSEHVAWAMLAEADELCRRPTRVSASSESSTAPSARSGAGDEALAIVRELAATIRDSKSQASILEASERSERLCAGEEPLPLAHGRSARSIAGSSPGERNALITPHLERLNEGARRGVERHREELASSAGTESSAIVRPASRKPADPRADREPKRSSIIISGGTRGHRERVERWSRIFRREAGLLRTSRRELQFDIDSYSLAGSRSACRTFGSVLARLDSEFEKGAPSRGLSLRVARMLGHYRRGVTECVAGRPAAAFGHLSEGDREWATVARTAARMLEPRPILMSALAQAGRAH